MIELQTSKGAITIELDSTKAPLSAANFEQYVKDGFYDGLIFHRVIDGFMIQGGGMNESMQEKPTRQPVKNEADNGLKNNKYTIAMARTADPHSASSQFFINTQDNEFLNFQAPTAAGWGYCVFGKVVAGTDVVDAISQVPTKRQGLHEDVPIEAVIITKATIIK